MAQADRRSYQRAGGESAAGPTDGLVRRRCTGFLPMRRHATIAALGALLMLAAWSAGTECAQAEDERLRRNAVVRVAEKAKGAVVSVHTTQVQRRYWYGWELPPVEGKGVGSGAIFHPEGYVITNAHVVDMATEILVDVERPDGEVVTHEAHIFAVDMSNDLAILRLVPPQELWGTINYPYLPLGRSDDLMLGETIIAIGNPYDIGITVTTGIVGGLNRTLRLAGEGRDVFHDFIQVDAAINVGNSGGPLFDITGRWIGSLDCWPSPRSPPTAFRLCSSVKSVKASMGWPWSRRWRI